MRVINNKTNDVEIVEYSLDTNEIYLDGRMIGEVKNVDNGSSNVFNRSSWSTIDANSEYISWAEDIGTAYYCSCNSYCTRSYWGAWSYSSNGNSGSRSY